MNKYLVIEFRKGQSGGIGDRLVGLVSAIQLSQVLQRQLLIKWDSPDLKQNFNYQEYDFYQYRFPSKPKITNINCIDSQRQLKDFFSQTNLLEAWNQSDIIIFRCNCNIGQYLYQNPYFQNTLKNYSYSQDIKYIYQNLYRKYLIPKEDITQIVNQYLEQFNTIRSENKKIIGLQIRTGDKYFESNGVEIVPNNDLNNIISYFHDILENKLNYNSDNSQIFLCYDNPIVENMVRIIFSNYQIIFYKAPIIHIDKIKNTINNTTNKNLDGFQKVIVDQILLSQTDLLLISNSYLARTAYLMGMSPGYCLRYNKSMRQYEIYELTAEFASSKAISINIWDTPKPKYIYQQCE